jgi:hypothetical protein
MDTPGNTDKYERESPELQDVRGKHKEGLMAILEKITVMDFQYKTMGSIPTKSKVEEEDISNRRMLLDVRRKRLLKDFYALQKLGE